MRSFLTRQLEPFFADYTGVSPKQLSSLVRYQYLWHDLFLRRFFPSGDADSSYALSDQSHLLHDFKDYHTLLPAQAKGLRIKEGGYSPRVKYPAAS